MSDDNVIDFNDWKYTRIAKEFIKLRAESPVKAADYARRSVDPKDFSTLSRYIEQEMIKNGDMEPHEE